MKKHLTIVITLVVLMMASTIFAQSTDTLKVYASKGGNPVFINDVVKNNPNYKVYLLMSTDTSYFFTNVITVSKDFELVGKVNAVTKRPPTIQPLELDDKSVPKLLLSVTGTKLNVALKNIFFLARSNANTIANTTGGDPGVVSISGDANTLLVDNCIFDTWHHFTFYYNSKDNNFTITNNVFRNGVMAGNNPWVGEILRNLDGFKNTGDVVMKNNTMLNIGAYSSCTHTLNGVNKSFVFENNTIVYGTKNPLFQFRVTNAKINNNIFYSTFCAGGNATSISGGWDDSDGGSLNSVIALDTLNSRVDSLFAPEYNTLASAERIVKCEQKRVVEVKNNVYYWPQNLKDFWKSFNDTASAANKRVLPIWMNDRTKGMFANKTTWPGFTESGNVEADPGFTKDIKDITTTGKFIDYLLNIYKGGPNSTIFYSYELNEPNGDLGWKPAWPLKENLGYANTSIKGTDGKPVGDARWHSYVDVEDDAVSFVPSQLTVKAYPNPFNPSTKVEFLLPEAGKVTVVVYDMLGQLVKTVVDGVEYTAGTHTAVVDLAGYASGNYIAVVKHNGNSVVSKIALVK